ncbi:cyclophilin-like fold protein [Streptomyces clavifer]|uniref:cyclophilin-like fold protein n=1 Tax=Streptomyces clavifer TaxID=68188 RepID=UPI0037ACB31C
MNDSATARDFAALLPLTLRMADFHHTERIADPPRRLDTSGAPEASEPKAGDLAYYAPWGNLAFFYRDGEHSPGLVILGRLDDIGDTGRLGRPRPRRKRLLTFRVLSARLSPAPPASPSPAGPRSDPPRSARSSPSSPAVAR